MLLFLGNKLLGHDLKFGFQLIQSLVQLQVYVDLLFVFATIVALSLFFTFLSWRLWDCRSLSSEINLGTLILGSFE